MALHLAERRLALPPGLKTEETDLTPENNPRGLDRIVSVVKCLRGPENILKNKYTLKWNLGFAGKESACNAVDTGLIPGSGRSPGEGNGNPLQYSCLENPMDRGTWQFIVPGVTKSRT